MTEFDKLYHFVQEMNRNWRELMDDIDSGRYQQRRATEIRQIPVVDAYVGVSYGCVSVDGNGMLQSINLDIDQIAQSNESDVLQAICAAINSPAAAAAPTYYHSEGVGTVV
ncbi:hypothetical protein [Nocardia fluminea]|uniref:hypothetical protein n=1 Tax=Nocardia fluminea TaxID=134984 RepID=UPI003D108CD5